MGPPPPPPPPPPPASGSTRISREALSEADEGRSRLFHREAKPRGRLLPSSTSSGSTSPDWKARMTRICRRGGRRVRNVDTQECTFSNTLELALTCQGYHEVALVFLQVVNKSSSNMQRLLPHTCENTRTWPIPSGLWIWLFWNSKHLKIQAIYCNKVQHPVYSGYDCWIRFGWAGSYQVSFTWLC